MSHPIIVINSAEIVVKYNSISETFVVDIILNNTMRVMSEFTHREPSALYELMRDAGIQMDEVKISFKWEPDRYSTTHSIISISKNANSFILYTLINNCDFEYAVQPETLRECFVMGCNMIKKNSGK